MKKLVFCLMAALLAAACLLSTVGCRKNDGEAALTDPVTAETTERSPAVSDTEEGSGLPSEESLAFSLNEDGLSYRVTGIGSFTGSDVIVPAEYEGLPVTVIGNKAFRSCSALTSITLPDSITAIEYEAFYQCEGLTSLAIPDSVTKIGRAAFQHCTGLTSLSLGNGLTSIGEDAFSHCDSIVSVVIPDSVTSIGARAFFIASLAEITVGENSTAYRSTDGILYNKDGTVLLLYPCGKQEATFAVPEGVTAIDQMAVSHCPALTSVTFPESLTSIGGSAFNGCVNLTSVLIPKTVTTMGWYVFSSCDSLTEILCEAEGRPSDWREDWIGSYTVPVQWGYQGE